MAALRGAGALAIDQLNDVQKPSATLVDGDNLTADEATAQPSIPAQLVALLVRYNAGQHMDCPYPNRVEWWRSLTAESLKKLVRPNPK